MTHGTWIVTLDELAEIVSRGGVVYDCATKTQVYAYRLREMSFGAVVKNIAARRYRRIVNREG